MAAEAGATASRSRSNERRVRFDEKTTYQYDDSQSNSMEMKVTNKSCGNEKISPCRSILYRRDCSDSRDSQLNRSLPSPICSSPLPSMLNPHSMPVQMTSILSASSSSASPLANSSTTTCTSSTATVVCTEQSSSRGRGWPLLAVTRNLRKNRSSTRRHTIMELSTPTPASRTQSNRLPRYSQLSRHSNEDAHSSGNTLENLNAVDTNFPPRYSTGTIPEILPIDDDDVFNGDINNNRESETVGTQARAIIFLFLCTVELVMGVILCIVAAKANSLRPSDMSTSSYTWPGILVGMM